MTKKRKITPTESIEFSGDPSLEHAYVKYPRENPVDVSGRSSEESVEFDGKKSRETSAGKTVEEEKRQTRMHTPILSR